MFLADRPANQILDLETMYSTYIFQNFKPNKKNVSAPECCHASSQFLFAQFPLGEFT